MQKVKDIFKNLTSAHRESKALREMVDGVYSYTGQQQELWDASLQEVMDRSVVRSHAGAETEDISPVGKHAGEYAGRHVAKDGEGENAVYYGKHRTAEQSGDATEMVEGGVRYSDRNENSP